MKYVIVDLEATCWEGVRAVGEIIEIGAVILASSRGPIVAEFDEFVKPVANPVLSTFCTKLTTISQEQVDHAEYFYQVFPRFVEWVGSEPFTFCSWGAYDLNQFKTDCKRHSIPFPISLENHLNLKAEFSTFHGKKCGMAKALEILGLKIEGVHHRGIDDARNIARIAQLIVKVV